MNDWKSTSGGRGGSKGGYGGPNGTTDKVDYSRLPLGSGGSEDDGEDWIQRQIRGHKVTNASLSFVSGCFFSVQ